MDLAVNLLNPQLGPRLDKLAKLIASLEPNLASHKIVPRKLPLSQGAILRAIQQVLAGFPDGLQAFEIRRMVEHDLGRKVPSSTIKSDLADNPAFERISYGRYRLR
jgi:hypothetical protein